MSITTEKFPFHRLKTLINTMSNYLLCTSHLSCVTTHSILFNPHYNPGDTVHAFLQKASKENWGQNPGVASEVSS